MERFGKSVEPQKKRKCGSPEHFHKKTTWKRNNRHKKLRQSFLVPLKLPFDASARGDATSIRAKIKNVSSKEDKFNQPADFGLTGSPNEPNRSLKTPKKLSNNFVFKEGEFVRTKRGNGEQQRRGVRSSPVFKFEAPGTLPSLSLAKQNSRQLIRINFKQPLAGNLFRSAESKTYNCRARAKEFSIGPEINELRFLKSCTDKKSEGARTTSSITATSVNVIEQNDDNESTFSETLIRFTSTSNPVFNQSTNCKSNCNRFNHKDQEEIKQNLPKESLIQSRVNPSFSSTNESSKKLHEKTGDFSKPERRTTGPFGLPSSDGPTSPILDHNQHLSSNCHESMSEFSKHLLRCLNPPKSNVEEKSLQSFSSKTFKPHQLVLETDSQPGPSHESSSNSLGKRIQEVKQMTPTSSPAQALIDLFGDRSHIAEILSKTVVNEHTDPRFRSTRNADEKKILEKSSDDEAFEKDTKRKNRFISLVREYSKEDDFSSAMACKSEASDQQGKKKMDGSSTNVFEILKRRLYLTDLVSVESDVELNDSLPNIGEHISRIEKSFLDIERAVNNIKKDVANLAFQQNLAVLINDNGRGRFDDLCKTFSDLKYFPCNPQPQEVKQHTMYQCINGGLALSVILFVWFMCGDMISITF